MAEYKMLFALIFLLGVGCPVVLVTPVKAQEGCISHPLRPDIIQKLVEAANVTISQRNGINCSATHHNTGCLDATVLATLAYVQNSLLATRDELAASKKDYENALATLSAFKSEMSSTMNDLDARKREWDDEINQISSIQSTLTTMRNELTELQKNDDTVSSKTAKCKSGWFLFQNSCYFFSTTKANWHDGRQSCRNMGGDYVKITTNAEYTFILSHIISNTWIGLSDLESEGTFKWISDGAVYEEDRSWWHNGQPDNAGRGEDCVHVWFAGERKILNDLDCGAALFYICEIMPETVSV